MKIEILIPVIFTLSIIVLVQQINAKTQFEFYHLNKPEWNSTVYLVEYTLGDKKTYKWIDDLDRDKVAFLPQGVKEVSSDIEPGNWGEGVVTLVINKNIDVGEPLRMCIYGLGENFAYQDERCEVTSVSKDRIAMVQIDLSEQ